MPVVSLLLFLVLALSTTKEKCWSPLFIQEDICIHPSSSILSAFFFSSVFVVMDQFLSHSGICYNIAPVFCFGFWAKRHVGSQLPNKGSNSLLLLWKMKSELLDHQGSLYTSLKNKKSLTSFRYLKCLKYQLFWYLKESQSVAQSCPTLCNPMDCSCQAPLSIGFPRQEYWSG